MNRTYLPRFRRKAWTTFFICLGIGICILSFGILSNNHTKIGHAHSLENLFRLHVIAHSDAPAEQHVKLLVRDALLQEMSLWPTPTTNNELEQVLRANEDKLQRTAVRTLKTAGFNHDVRVEIGHFTFDERIAGGIVFPAGQYRAVKVIIGAGAGKNWWCVLFPPLCFVDDSTEVHISPSNSRLNDTLPPFHDLGDVQLIDAQTTGDFQETGTVQVRLKLWESISQSVYAKNLRERWLASNSKENQDTGKQ